jgi:hypothetical protein
MMDSDYSYDSIAILEVEISSFSGGGYKVKYDFNRNMITWNDGYMWNNNFTRSLNDTDYNTIKEGLPKSGMLEWMKGYESGLADEYGDKTTVPGEWKIMVKFTDDTKLTAGAQQHSRRNGNTSEIS